MLSLRARRLVTELGSQTPRQLRVAAFMSTAKDRCCAIIADLVAGILAYFHIVPVLGVSSGHNLYVNTYGSHVSCPAIPRGDEVQLEVTVIFHFIEELTFPSISDIGKGPFKALHDAVLLIYPSTMCTWAWLNNVRKRLGGHDTTSASRGLG